VKRFRFGLESLRRWRELALESAEAELARLQADRDEVRREAASLAERMSAEREEVRRDGVEGWRLAAADEWLQYAAHERLGLLRKEREAAARIEQQLGEVREARIRVETLEKLKARRKEEWRKAAEAEVEQMVAELVVSRWKRS
jgi:flagellar biosynthesis chaperone FliJ